jgi:hypothetical protein
MCTHDDVNERTEARRAQLRHRLHGLRLLLIDEKSLISYELLAQLDVHSRWVFEDERPFAGLHIVMFSNFYQLDPVLQSPLYDDPKPRSSDTARRGRELFKAHVTTFFELTTPNFRMGADPVMHAIEERLCNTEEPTPEMLLALAERVTTVAEARAAVPADVLWTVLEHAQVDALNVYDLSAKRTASATVVNVAARRHFTLRGGGARGDDDALSDADDESGANAAARSVDAAAARRQMTPELREALQRAPHERKRARRQGEHVEPLPPTLTLVVGSRVALTRHIAPGLGLVKDATGTLVAFVYSANAGAGPAMPGADVAQAARSAMHQQVPTALVQMDEHWYTGTSAGACVGGALAVAPRVVPITPVETRAKFRGHTYTSGICR